MYAIVGDDSLGGVHMESSGRRGFVEEGVKLVEGGGGTGGWKKEGRKRAG